MSPEHFPRLSTTDWIFLWFVDVKCAAFINVLEAKLGWSCITTVQRVTCVFIGIMCFLWCQCDERAHSPHPALIKADAHDTEPRGNSNKGLFDYKNAHFHVCCCLAPCNSLLIGPKSNEQRLHGKSHINLFLYWDKGFKYIYVYFIKYQLAALGIQFATGFQRNVFSGFFKWTSFMVNVTHF